MLFESCEHARGKVGSVTLEAASNIVHKETVAVYNWSCRSFFLSTRWQSRCRIRHLLMPSRRSSRNCVLALTLDSPVYHR